MVTKYTIARLQSLSKKHGVEFKHDNEEVAAFAPKGFKFKSTDCGVAIRNFEMFGGRQNAYNGLAEDIKSGLRKKQ